MHSFTLCYLLVTVVATAFAHSYDNHEPAHYKFAYGVSDHHTGDHHQHHEVSDGHMVKGFYSLKEADGTTRIVEYVSGPHSGFNAVVKRIGYAKHPQHYKTYGGQNKEGEKGGLVGLGGKTSGHKYGKAESYVGTTHWGGYNSKSSEFGNGKAESHVDTTNLGSYDGNGQQNSHLSQNYQHKHEKAESYVGTTHWGGYDGKGQQGSYSDVSQNNGNAHGKAESYVGSTHWGY